MTLPPRRHLTATLAALCTLASGCATWTQTADQDLVIDEARKARVGPQGLSELQGPGGRAGRAAALFDRTFAGCRPGAALRLRPALRERGAPPAARSPAKPAGLPIDRVFEHGEALAYARMLLGYVFPTPDAQPAITEILCNFNDSANVVAHHSMRKLAVGLARAAKQPLPADCAE